MDNKQAASGDNTNRQESGDQESQKNHPKPQGVSLEYANSALTWLLTFSTAPDIPQDPIDQKQWKKDWTKRLSMQPHWKLKRLNEFSSPYLKDIWKFLEELRPPSPAMPDYLKALPAPNSNIGQDCLAYILGDDEKKIPGLFSLSGKEADEYEKNFIAAMREKYPNRTWFSGRISNKGF